MTDGNLYTIDPTSGASDATFHTRAGHHHAGDLDSPPLGPAVGEQVFFADRERGHVYALARVGTTNTWSDDRRGGRTAAALADGRLIVGAAAFDVETGERRWVADTFAAPSSHAVADGTAYVSGVGPNRAAVRALDVATSEERWRAGVSERNPDFAVVDSRVYVGNRALDAETGDELWVTPSKTSALATVDGRVFAGLWNDGRVVERDPETGEPLWSYDVVPTANEYAEVGGLAVVDGRLLVTVGDIGGSETGGRIVAIG